MAVDITGITKTLLAGSKTDDAKAATTPASNQNKLDSTPSSAGQNNPVVTPVDKVTLTRQAEELHMIEQAINGQTDIDDERIENLKLEINTGRYDIDSQRVAEKLIEFEMLFVA